MGLTLGDISRSWVTGLCRDLLDSTKEVEVSSYSLTELGGAQGVISSYEKSTPAAIVGHRLLTIQARVEGKARELRLVLKSKARGAVIRRRLEEVYHRIDPRLAELQHALSPSILDDCHLRELRIYQLERAGLRSIIPAIGRVWIDETAEIYVAVMELLEGVRHEKTLSDLDVWTVRDIECALSQIARVHGEHLGGISATEPPPWLVPFSELNNARLLEYQEALLRYNSDSFPDLFDAPRIRRIEAFLASALERHRSIMSRPLTLAHGDFTPRNICLKVGGDLRLCAYDWELAQVHLPQRDVCELLCYVLDPRRGWRDGSASHLLESHRASLQAASGRVMRVEEYREDFAAALAEFCSFKLLVQGVTHRLLGNRYYFERLVQSSFDAVEAFADIGD